MTFFFSMQGRIAGQRKKNKQYKNVIRQLWQKSDEQKKLHMKTLKTKKRNRND